MGAGRFCSSGRTVHELRGHQNALLDATFSVTGSQLVTASADGTARVYAAATGACQSILLGHEGPVAKAAFNPQGTCVLTAGADGAARLWDAATGDCFQVGGVVEARRRMVVFVCVAVVSTDSVTCIYVSSNHQVLSGHGDEVFSCAFSYAGDTIVTAGKDNACRIWRY